MAYEATLPVKDMNYLVTKDEFHIISNFEFSTQVLVIIHDTLNL